MIRHILILQFSIMVAYSNNSAICKSCTAADAEPVLRSWHVELAGDSPSFEWISTEGTIHSLEFDGPEYMGRHTRVYALYADPSTLNPNTAVTTAAYPAILLIHGGGGESFPHWVKQWAERGYAAMALDMGSKNNPSSMPGPSMGRQLYEWHLGDTDRWFYHATANAISAHSLLRNLPQIDKDRTAILGVSWGGFITLLTAGLDHRFSVAVSAYGTGHLFDGTRWDDLFSNLPPATLEDWKTRWDPIAYLAKTPVPIFMVNGDSDPFFYIRAMEKTIQIAPNVVAKVIPGLPHGHSPIFQLDDIFYLIDKQLGKSPESVH